MSDDWRSRDIDALDERTRLLGDLIHTLLAVEAMFETDRDAPAIMETRSYAALLRDRAAGYTDRARKLRAEREPVSQPLPMRVTRRVG